MDKKEFEKFIFRDDLHIQAGLSFSGQNGEGQNEYIGTTKQWKKYEQLIKEQLTN